MTKLYSKNLKKYILLNTATTCKMNFLMKKSSKCETVASNNKPYLCLSALIYDGQNASTDENDFTFKRKCTF